MFLESSEAVHDSFFNMKSPDDFIWRYLLEIRSMLKLAIPTHILWLDCIHAKYFESLDWVNADINFSNNPHACEARRQQIMMMDTKRFIVAQWLINETEAHEKNRFHLLHSCEWHRVSISDTAGEPVYVGPNYNIIEGGGEIKYVTYLRPANEHESTTLYKVFNVDFIEELNDDDTSADVSDPPSPLDDIVDAADEDENSDLLFR